MLTINGSTVFYLNVQYEQVKLVCTGSSWIIAGANFDVFSTGQIIPWSGTSVPAYALECNGANVNRTTYARLFEKIGTIYGLGDGSTTFGLPEGASSGGYSESNHIGEEHYASSGITLNFDDYNKLSFSTKKNFKTESTELYDLDYQYNIDCLTAGLVYRREFYQDSEFEPKNTLMFTITFVPFASVNSPSLNQ